MSTLLFNKRCSGAKLEAEMVVSGLIKGTRFFGVTTDVDTTSVYVADDFTDDETTSLNNLVTNHDPDTSPTDMMASTWIAWCESNGKDSTYLRDHLKAIVIPNWANLPDLEKKKCIELYCYPPATTQADIDAFFTGEEQVKNWASIVHWGSVARSKRWLAAAEAISFYLNQAEMLDIYVSTKEYSLWYRDANIPALTLWLVNGAYPALGIDFTTNGFAQKPYYTDARRDLLINILINGNY